MKLVSTRNPALTCSFREACATSLAPDGGLWAPTELRPMPRLAEVLRMPWPEQAAAVLQHVLGDEVPAATLVPLVQDAFDFPLPLRELAPDVHTLELFHGPTLAFKDFGARLLARLLPVVDQGVALHRQVFKRCGRCG